MADSLVKIDVHIVFHVKTDCVRIRHEDLAGLHAYIGGIARNLGGIDIKVGGIIDHVHILAGAPKNMAVPDFVRDIKRSSCLWPKNRNRYYYKFQWQDGYGAFSVSHDMIEKVS